MERTYYIYKGKKYTSRAAVEEYLLTHENKNYNDARNISANCDTVTIEVKTKPKKTTKTNKRGK